MCPRVLSHLKSWIGKGAVTAAVWLNWFGQCGLVGVQHAQNCPFYILCCSLWPFKNQTKRCEGDVTQDDRELIDLTFLSVIVHHRHLAEPCLESQGPAASHASLI